MGKSLALLAILVLAVVAYLSLGERDLPEGVQAEHGRAQAAETGDGELSSLPQVENERSVLLQKNSLQQEERGELQSNDSAQQMQQVALIATLRFAQSGELVKFQEVTIDAPQPSGGKRVGFQRLKSDDSGRIFLSSIAKGSYTFFLWSEESVALGWRILPNRFLLAQATDALPVELELSVETCERFFDVELVTSNAAESQATVYFVCARPERITRTWRTGSKPLRFGYSTKDLGENLLVWAEGESGEYSQIVALDGSNMPAKVQLEMKQSAHLEVRVWDAHGQPASGREVGLLPRDDSSFLRNLTLGTTDANGRVDFPKVGPAPFSISVRNSSGHFRHYAEVRLGPGEKESIELNLPPDVPLAFSGVMLDELGAALPYRYIQVKTVGPSLPWVESVRTDEEGRFSMYMQPCASILLNPNLAPRGDRFLPASLSIAHGSEQLVFRRVAAAVERSFHVLAVDQESGAPLGDVVPTFDLGPGSQAMAASYAANTNFEVFVQANTHMHVAVRGYHKLDVPLQAALDALEPGASLRLELRRGLRMRLCILDGNTEAPMEGVSLLSAGGERFLSGPDGWAEVNAAQWEPFQVSKQGYRSEECDPEDVVLWNDDLIFLNPLEESD